VDEPRFPDPSRSRAVLIGVSRFQSEELPAIPAVRANLRDVRTALTHPTLGTFSAEDGSCQVLGDDTDPGRVGRALNSACDHATDLLLVYYSGHGLVDSDGRLHLTVRSTDPENLRWTAIPIELLKRELGQAKAKARMLILDCCFSGQAIEAMANTASLVTGQLTLTGTFTLTSTTANEPAHAPPGSRNTAFTGALLRALASPTPLTLEGIYRHIDEELVGLGLPRPQCRSVNTVRDLALVRGPVCTPDPPRTGSRSAETAPSAQPAPRSKTAGNSRSTPVSTTAPKSGSGSTRQPTSTSEETLRRIAAAATPPTAQRPQPPQKQPADSSRIFELVTDRKRWPRIKAILWVGATLACVIAVVALANTPWGSSSIAWHLAFLVGKLLAIVLGFACIPMTFIAMSSVRDALPDTKVPWTRLLINNLGVTVEGGDDRYDVPWAQIERAKLARLAGEPSSAYRMIVLCLKHEAPRPRWRGLPKSHGGTEMVGLGRCANEQDVWDALKRFAPLRKAEKDTVVLRAEDIRRSPLNK
jgi:hypothetical protein